MNDRFKFRVWDKTNKKWLDTSELFLNSEGLLVRPDDQGGYIFDDVDYDVIFCTGLKDKNGKLIYEGDILKGEFGNIEVVEWIGKRIDDEFEWTGFGLDYHSNESEIIGNIYENPELIKSS